MNRSVTTKFVTSVHEYGTAQRYTHTQSLGSAPVGDICSAHYEHACACWDYSYVEQNLPVTCVYF